MPVSLAGFKPCAEVPAFRRTPGSSIYDPVITRTSQGFGPYMLDTGDPKRATSLANTLRMRIRKREITTVTVMVRSTTVYVTKK